MSNNGHPALPLFNNKKSLYGCRTQNNQSSKKISIVEDKQTLEPVRLMSGSTGVKSLVAPSFQRSRSIPASLPPSLSSSQIQKQIEIQKNALHSYPLEKLCENVSCQLNEWRSSMHNRVYSMKDRMSQQNTQAYQEVTRLTEMMKSLLDEFLTTMMIMQSNRQAVDTEEIDRIEKRLDAIKTEIDSIQQFNLQLHCSDVDVVGELQLNKLTDFSKHQPLPRPPASPPPRKQMFSSISMEPPVNEPSSTLPAIEESTEIKPTAPVWTDATRQGLNSVAHNLPFRLLISHGVQEQLIGEFDIEQFSSMLSITSQSAAESIMTIIHQNTLDETIEILSDLLDAFKCSSDHFEIRLLFQKKFIPIITGKRHERLDRLKLKYQLEMIQVFPQPCPNSDERVVLLRCYQSEYIVFCLREIIQNILEQAHFSDDYQGQNYPLYDPSLSYDESIIQDYGGYKLTHDRELNSFNDSTVSNDD